MNRTMRLGATVMVASIILAGCSGASPAASGGTATPAGSTARGQTELTILSTADWVDGYNQVIEAFEAQNPDIRVNLEVYPFGQMLETIEVKLTAKDTKYDLVEVDGPLVASYTVKGYLEPLDQYLTAEKQAAWVQSSIDAGTYDGQLMAAPHESSTGVLFYNKALLEAASVTPPSEDPADRWTWEELLDAAKTLTVDTNGDGQIDQWGFSFDQVGRLYQLAPLAQSLGAHLLDPTGLVASGYFNSAESLMAAQFYADLFNKYGVSPKLQPAESPEYFKTDKVAFFVGGPWNVGRFDGVVDFGIAPHPYFAGGVPVTPTGSIHLGISAYSKNKDAAAKFLEFDTIGKGAEIWFNKWQSIPATVDLLSTFESDPAYEQPPKSIFRLGVHELNETAVPRPLTPGYLEFETLANQAYSDIMNGSDPKTVLDDAAAQMDSQLQKYAGVSN